MEKIALVFGVKYLGNVEDTAKRISDIWGMDYTSTKDMCYRPYYHVETPLFLVPRSHYGFRRYIESYLSDTGNDESLCEIYQSIYGETWMSLQDYLPFPMT